MAGIFPNRFYQYWQYKRDKYKKKSKYFKRYPDINRTCKCALASYKHSSNSFD